jgi:hypothetical protein
MTEIEIKFEKEETRYGEAAEWSIMVDGRWFGSIRGEREGMKEASTSRACSMKIVGYTVEILDGVDGWFPANQSPRAALKAAKNYAMQQIGGR